MTTTWRIGVDWNQDAFFCWDARPGDPLNLVINPINWATIPFVATGTSASDSQGAEATDYGNNVCTWTSGISSAGALAIGNTTTRLTDALTQNTAYTLIFWIKSNSASYDAVPLDVTVLDQAANTLITDTNFTVAFADGWTKIKVNFTTGAGDTGAYMVIRKDTSVTNAVYKLTGFMIVPGTYTLTNAPGFNAGEDSDLYENLVPYAMEAQWNVGARQAYINIADNNICTLTLNNTSRVFSPENASSALTGIMANRQCRVYAKAPAASTFTLMYTGYLESIDPQTGANTGKTAMLRATSARRFFEGKQIKVALQTSVSADDVLIAVFLTVELPAAVALNLTADTGTFTWPYAGENWSDGVDALQAIADIVASERGYLYWDRTDAAIFKNRTWRYDSDDQVPSLSATFDNMQENADYVYGADIYNEIEVTYYPRKTGSAGTQLWELNEDIALSPLESEVIIARFTKGDRDKPIGASGVATGTFTSSGTINHSESATAQSCEITYTNPSGINTRTVTAHTLTGTPIIPYDAITLVREDATSITDNGRRPMTLDLKLVATRPDAKQIAELTRSRFKDPIGRMVSITVGKRDSTIEGLMVTLEVRNRIRVIEDQTQHDRDYIIMGESHTLRDALTVHKTEYFLEPVVDLI